MGTVGDGLLAFVAAYWDLVARDLLWVRHLPALNFSAYGAFWNLCHVRVRNRGLRCTPCVPVVGEHFHSQKDV